MSGEDIQQILELLKAETGKEIRIQTEDGDILFSTRDPQAVLLWRALKGRIPREEISARASGLGLQTAGSRCLFLVEFSGGKQDLLQETAECVLGENLEGSLITFVKPGQMAVVVRITSENQGEAAELATLLSETLEAEVLIRSRIGISGLFSYLTELPTAGREAETALQVGQLFYRAEAVIPYEKLGLGLAAWEISEEAGKRYIRGVLGEYPEQVLEDDELSHTAEVLLKNSLNGAETARQLYIHRNTLTYRLDKIQRLIGLDLRNFEEAATSQLASMIWRRQKGGEIGSWTSTSKES